LINFNQKYNLSEYIETLKGFIPGPEYPDVLRSLNGPQWGLYYEKPDRFALFLFAFPFAFESSLSTLLEMQKASH